VSTAARILTICRLAPLDSVHHTIERCRRNTQSFEQPAVEQSAVLAHPNRHTIECVDSDSFALLIAR